jgi:hypothetical protein
MPAMNSATQLRNSASDVVDAARRFDSAAQVPESYPGAPDALAALEEAFQVLSAAWYRLAADASQDLAGARPRAGGLSREQEVRVLATLHDVAAAFARSARTCRTGRSKVAPIIERRFAATRWQVREHQQPERHVA